jgi:hypothetical protein
MRTEDDYSSRGLYSSSGRLSGRRISRADATFHDAEQMTCQTDQRGITKSIICHCQGYKFDLETRWLVK